MRTIIAAIGGLVLFGGVLLFFAALMHPRGFPLQAASAVQITQVYSEATYYAVLAVGAFILAGVLLMATWDKTLDE